MLGKPNILTSFKNAHKQIIVRLGNRVRELRGQHGFTQEGLSEKAGVSRNYVDLVERGETNPSIVKLLCIADALGVDVTSLFKK